MKALILAGGKGTRLLPLTINTPKPIVSICNRPFLLYQLDMLKNAGIKDIILSLGYKSEKIEEVLGNGRKFGVNLQYAVETEPLGTAGAFKFAGNLVKETTVVLNGDSLTDLDLNNVLKFHFEKKSLATVVLTQVENPSNYGLIEIFDDGSINRFVEKPSFDEISCNTINAGTYILEPDIMKYIPQKKYFMFENGVFPLLLNNKESFHAYLPQNTYWLDIGTPRSYLQAHFDLMNEIPNMLIINRNKSIPSKFSDGVSFISENSHIGERTIIKQSSVGEGCFIGKGCLIENSVLLPFSRIEDGCSINFNVIGENCLIGKHTKLPERLFLGDNSIISDNSLSF